MIKKIAPLQYAIFLYELTLKAVGNLPAGRQVKKKVNDFFEVLVKNNDSGKISEIIREFEAYEKKQRGVEDVEIISARPAGLALKRQVSGLLKDGGKSEIKETVDPDMIGGLTMIIGDTMIDGSLRRKLRELKKVLS
ncbi:MAG: ATP synthase F1 subunit delta [bacterium]|nr:ATP synthase F1 subunit delta [bacterium]